MDLIHYDCITAAGLGAQSLFAGLEQGLDHSRLVQKNEWRHEVTEGGRVCFLERPEKLKNAVYLDQYEFFLNELWNHFHKGLSAEQIKNLKKSKTLIILASTKGTVEDYIWNYRGGAEGARLAPDPFVHILNFLKEKCLSACAEVDTLAVSNACASSHLAFEVAQQNLKYGFYEAVLVVAGDLIGPFIYQGFQSLKVLSPTKNKPFSGERDGLQLGEALAILLFTSENKDTKNIRMTAVASDTEGGSVTRPSTNGESLLRALKKVKNQTLEKPDLFIAHGTGTKFNDASEEQALYRFSTENQISAPATGLKWSIGHTLGASGALDVIAASEVMKTKKIFRLESSAQKDQNFQISYLTKDCPIHNSVFRHVVVTSLGFGGVHAALQLESPQ